MDLQRSAKDDLSNDRIRPPRKRFWVACLVFSRKLGLIPSVEAQHIMRMQFGVRDVMTEGANALLMMTSSMCLWLAALRRKTRKLVELRDVPERLKKRLPIELPKELPKTPAKQRMKRGESAEGGRKRLMRLEGRRIERHAEQREGNRRLRKRENVKQQRPGKLNVRRGVGFVNLRRKPLLMMMSLTEWGKRSEESRQWTTLRMMIPSVEHAAKNGVLSAQKIGPKTADENLHRLWIAISMNASVKSHVAVASETIFPPMVQYIRTPSARRLGGPIPGLTRG
jgi:hypothetical protein